MCNRSRLWGCELDTNDSVQCPIAGRNNEEFLEYSTDFPTKISHYAVCSSQACYNLRPSMRKQSPFELWGTNIPLTQQHFTRNTSFLYYISQSANVLLANRSYIYIYIYTENRKKHINALCGWNADIILYRSCLLFFQSTCPLSVAVLSQTCQSLKIPKTPKKNSMVRVHERTTSTERPPLVGEVIANFSG
jgi:hypothetical protein